MKIVLLQDVKTLGKKGDVVDVSDGYARNYVLPRKLGVEATSKNLNDLKLQKAHEEKLEALKLADAQALGRRVETGSVTVSVKAGKDGKVFGSVSTKEIARAVQEQMGLELDKKRIQLEEPIKNLGTVQVPVRLHKDVTAMLTVRVAEG
ncbi:MAG: 50S ribosomal protein L9 [Lachnospiraceae bacterium]|nr:50S ribosomal protein L9 [Lachnospiraceae bacterium]